MSGFVINPRRQANPTWDPEIDRPFRDDDIWAFHSSFSEYRATPLHVLPELARRLNVGGLAVKDESFRFGLNAFKVLGASYAVYRFLREGWEKSGQPPFAITDLLCGQVLAPGAYTFCTATDGNHGRAVAWIARRLSQAAVIYMPENSAPARVRSIRAEGAEVVIVNGTYDDTVRKAQTDAARNGWQIIAIPPTPIT